MILTITPNAALDRVLFIPEFTPTQTMRTLGVIDCVGGKGLDASVVLQTLQQDIPNQALTFLAGQVGRRLAEILEGYGIQTEVVWIEGETRIAHVVVETNYHRHSHIITEGYQVTSLDVEAFLARYRSLVGAQMARADAGWVILAGSLPGGAPTGFYRKLIEIAQVNRCQTLVDCPGEPARLAARAKPDILKMNRSEFANTFGGQAKPMEALSSQARLVLEQHNLPAIVITCGVDGILAILPEASYLAASPPQQEVNAAGAGDAVSACLAWRLGEGDDWPQALRWAAAASAAVVLTEATAECRREDVDRIMEQVTVYETHR